MKDDDQKQRGRILRPYRLTLENRGMHIYRTRRSAVQMDKHHGIRNYWDSDFFWRASTSDSWKWNPKQYAFTWVLVTFLSSFWGQNLVLAVSEDEKTGFAHDHDIARMAFDYIAAKSLVIFEFLNRSIVWVICACVREWLVSGQKKGNTYRTNELDWWISFLEFKTIWVLYDRLPRLPDLIVELQMVNTETQFIFLAPHEVSS